jgi:GT2 family glycosyltransferase
LNSFSPISRLKRHEIRAAVLHAFPETTATRNLLLALIKTLRLLSVLKYPGENELHLRVAGTPAVSIVIPTFNNASLTFRCVNSIRANPITASFEIIIVDDGSRFLHKRRLRGLSGVTVVSLRKNGGFILACNAGVAKARAEIVVMLNNDTYPHAGWLDALMGNFLEPKIGLVGAKLIYPDGTLQEAGGIIFSDGSAANYGRGGSPDDPQYTYRRDTDYCSGAAIAVRRALLVESGGFDTRFENAYYEDTDLAMRIRSLGYRVLYEPASVVTHIENATYSESASTLMAKNKKTFERKWQTELTTFASRIDYYQSSNLRRNLDPRPTILILDDFPRWKHDSGALRLRHIIRTYLNRDFRVTLVSAFTGVEPSYLAEMMHLGVQIVNQHNPDLLKYLKSVEFDLVFAHVARVHYMRFFMETIAPQLRALPLLYDTVDLHFLRNERELALNEGSVPRRRAQEIDVRRNEELGFIAAADVALVVSTAEQNLLAELGVGANVAVVPNAHSLLPATGGTLGREGLLFVGNFNHEPNEDAMNWFLNMVYPIIQDSAGDITVTLVGTPAPVHLEHHSRPAVKTLGWVENLAPVYARARVAIAPLRYGAGIKGKVGEAWSHGVPVVMTDVGAEGMHVVSGETALLANTAQEFAAAVLALLREDAPWLSLAKNGRLHVETHFGLEPFTQALTGVTSRLMAMSPLHKNQN